MKDSLQKYLSKLDDYQSRNAYMLHGDIDPRVCCKSLCCLPQHITLYGFVWKAGYCYS
jgi:hypothetical protein